MDAAWNPRPAPRLRRDRTRLLTRRRRRRAPAPARRLGLEPRELQVPHPSRQWRVPSRTTSAASSGQRFTLSRGRRRTLPRMTAAQTMTQEQAHATLTAPGAPFEVVEDDVLGHRMKVYKQRFTSLREVAAFAQTRGDNDTFLVYGDRRWSTGQFLREANSVGKLLSERCNVGQGERVAVLSANNPQWCLTFWGTVDIGAILVGLNGWWKADEILYGLQDSGSRVLVADRGRIMRIAANLDQLPDLEHVYLIDCAPGDVGLYGDARVHSFDELLTAPHDELPDAKIDEDDPAVIFYTSGTTGRPKGAISTHRSMLANLQNTLYYGMSGALRMGVNPLASDGGEERSALLTSPLFHVSGCHSGLVVGLMLGIKLVIPEGRFDPEKVLSLIQDERVAVWATVPTMVWRVCEYPGRQDYDTSSVTSVAYGGGVLGGGVHRLDKRKGSNGSRSTQ